jgi:hypothetical protein
MSLLVLAIIVLVVLAILVYAVNAIPAIPQPFRWIIIVLMCLAAALFLLSRAGVI